jgi:hypothetical protein
MTFPLDQRITFFPFMPSGYQKGESCKYCSNSLRTHPQLILKTDFVYLLFEVNKMTLRSFINDGELKQSEILLDIPKMDIFTSLHLRVGQVD